MRAREPQKVRLANNVWAPLESHLQQNPTDDPVWEVVRRWQEFVGSVDGDGVIKCVQITLAILTAPPAPPPILSIDSRIHQGQYSFPDNRRGAAPPNLHRGRLFNHEQGPTSYNPSPSLKAPDLE